VCVKALVTVQGGELSVTQLVAELSRLIPERWQWQVTQQGTNSFIVPFPSRGDLLCSVAFEKVHIKEHNVDILFEEWQPEEEGFPLQRVRIRIFRLLEKLKEFSVLWALGSMLGATLTVDMITSLKQNYGRVEVVVLNVDLIRNMIDTVVIGDSLFSLPIQVEGTVENEEHGVQIDLDEGAGGSANGHGKLSDSSDKSSRGTQKHDKPEGSGSNNGTPSGGNHGNRSSKERTGDSGDSQAADENVFPLEHRHKTGEGSSHTKVVSEGAPTRSAQHVILSETPDVELAQGYVIKPGHEGKQVQQENAMPVATDAQVHGTVPHEMGSGSGSLHNNANGQNGAGKLVPENPLVTPIKRSKRREGSVDEDSSSRAERLKAKKNLDVPGMSKARSFLSFPNAKIKSSFRFLGISAGTNVDRSIDNIKDLEHQRLLEATQLESENWALNTSDGEGMSDMDIDFEMDHQAIKHLNGDITGDTLGIDGSLFIDFKPSPRLQKTKSSRKKRAKSKLTHKNCHSR
jgi:hypothetical protein